MSPVDGCGRSGTLRSVICKQVRLQRVISQQQVRKYNLAKPMVRYLLEPGMHVDEGTGLIFYLSP
jgi:hypothetical protein